VRFVHNGSGVAPAFSISISDGAAGAGPYSATIVFNGVLILPPPPPPGGGGGGSTGITPPVLPPIFPILPAGVPNPTTTAFQRSPTALPGEESAAAEASAAPKRSASASALRVAAAELPPVRAEMDALETKPQRTELDVEPFRGELQVLPTRHALELNDDDRQRIEVVLNSIRITGLALSVGAVWWAARAAGLIASLLASTPAWRHVDPLPVLGRRDEEEEASDAITDEERELRDEEHRARWVLEERESKI